MIATTGEEGLPAENSHTPEIIFLLRVMISHGTGWKANRAEVRRNSAGEESSRLLRSRSYRSRVLGFYSSRWDAMALTIGFVDEPKQMVIVNMLDLVGQYHKLAVDLIQLSAFKMIAELLTTQAERMTSRVFAQHQFRIWHSDRLRRHDLVGQPVLQHAVLMDAGFVREGVAADDRLVRLHRNSSNFLKHLARGIELLGRNSGLIVVPVCAHS